MLVMGAFPGIQPGEILKNGLGKVKITIPQTDLAQRKKLVYLIGEGHFDIIPDCDYLIYQNAIPPSSSRQPDLILPTSLFPESPGTTINMEGRILKLEKATGQYMEAKPDWWIITAIGNTIKKGKFKYKDIASIQSEMKKYLGDFLKGRKKAQFSSLDFQNKGRWMKGSPKPSLSGFPIAARAHYRGVSMSQVVAGMKVIEEWVRTSSCSEKEAQ
jgi:NADH dehydrogenase/NADH:ubiquinone oxidoreductase subunit G